MNHQTFNELDLTSLLSLSFSTLITELHDRLSELGFEDIKEWQEAILENKGLFLENKEEIIV